ncbi:MAG: ABC-F family ATP-binding cassette domain-containing protein [Floccifex porci]|uniref:ABC-F family ATP-binding cassette domain-containing protein n=1 Tax=Floccifex porci TaxID=2606629 RepID=A0A7X2T3B8_9FIRM|nr:ABC-F family ATP-binding cassette domain-containing protein [Floccifex porci]MCI7802876.1 ABC-F family ATP-binding cassette domain-containing protein [Erysipelotrichaceae bacterium]MDD7467477.1 ABC-F family ATP-binding cassette domain-containing protein [Floccifex porci]MDO4480657.1 ABC-F family ATP-binding cassette domain-containing protein [Erysipelotrichaceae bacterium]MDY4796309.1 ABC-F family ATP-binding cassette domain-containing protein [Floccifex porci]MSS01265.1 ABC-F family ATP-bi
MKLQLSHVKKSYGTQDVLIDANLLIKDHEKVALVGRNGCGKSTLLKIICHQESMDEGNLTIPQDVKIGYLSQITFLDEHRTVHEELLDVFKYVREIENQLNQQAKVLETNSSEKELEKYALLQHKFESLNGYNYEVELKNVFFHFQFTQEDLKKQLCEFSSGQKTRIALVKLLLSKPDVLLLDEPTNHLDLESIEWLENYIQHYPSAVILVSHDRMFLDHVIDEVIEIEFGRTTRYVGNYSHYVKAKEEYLIKNHDAYIRQQQEIQRLETLIEKFRYKKNKAAFAKSKQKYLDRMDRIEDSKSDQSMMKAAFSSFRKGGKQVLEVDHLKVGYDTVLSDVSFTLMQHQRMGIVGRNGIGKSTLIKTLVNQIPSLGGQFRFGHQIDIGYFDQESAQMSSDKNVLDELWDENTEATQTEIRNTLASFLFTQDEVFKDVSNLSGGEKVRLALAKLMMDHDNLLILDEPTNHLDIPSKEALEKALENYDGTLLFVSHDRMFLKKMASRILEMDQESKVYDLTYEEYCQKKIENTLIESVKVEKNESQKTFQDMKALKNRVVKLENLLEEAEKDLEALRELRFEPEYYQDFQKMDQLNECIDLKHNEINSLMKEWEEKMQILEEH